MRQPPNRKGVQVGVVVFDEGTALVPGLIRRNDGDRLQVLLKLRDGFKVHSVLRSVDYVDTVGEGTSQRWAEAFAQLRLEQRRLDMMLPASMSGARDVKEPVDLIGREVSFIVYNGVCVQRVLVESLREYDNELRIVYQLPGKLGPSAVPLCSIAHLHTHLENRAGE